MPKLYRPHVPLSVRVEVASRQLRRQFGKPGTVKLIQKEYDTWALQLAHLLFWLAKAFGCEVSDLRLDHFDPPLAARQRTGEGKATRYVPDANDPEHLEYRPHGVEFDRSHDVKTRIRGDHGQYSDVVLIKRERRRQKREAEQADAKNLKKKRRNWRSGSGPKKPAAKRPWPKRPFPKGRGFERRTK